MPKIFNFQRLNKHPKHRLSMLKNMAASLFLQERIVTTKGKARVLLPFVDRLFAGSLKNTPHLRRKVMGTLRIRHANIKLMTDIKVRFGSTTGSILRMTPLLARRKGDNSVMARVELYNK
jgi:ribosomal protein L17